MRQRLAHRRCAIAHHGGDRQLGPGARQFRLQGLRQQRFVLGDQGGGGGAGHAAGRRMVARVPAAAPVRA
jgi:hypothetical protein